MLNEVKSAFGGKKKYMIVGALTVAIFAGAVGGSTLNALKANAQTPAVVTAENPVDTKVGGTQIDPIKGGHVGANGVKEELLTGDTAEKVKAAALAANPGATIDRVETDAEGAPYEAHITNSDGTRVTLKFDTDFKVTSTETGKGR